MKKRSFVDQIVPPPTFPKSQGLQPCVFSLLPKWNKSNNSLAEYPNTAGVAALLLSLRPQKSNSQISKSCHQITLISVGVGKKLPYISFRDRQAARNQQKLISK